MTKRIFDLSSFTERINVFFGLFREKKKKSKNYSNLSC